MFYKAAVQISVSLVLVLAFMLGLLFVVDWDDNTGYLQGSILHYQGESVVTPDQWAYLLSQDVVWQGVGRTVELLGDSSVKLQYDFYSAEELDYLTVLPFSTWGTPALHAMTSLFDGSGLMSLIILAVGIILIYVIYRVQMGKAPGILSFAVKAQWYLLHPDLLWRNRGRSPLAEVYYQGGPPKVGPLLVSARDRLLAIRTWGYSGSSGQLKSSTTLAESNTWSSRFAVAHKVPGEGDTNGIYVYRLGTVKTDFSGVHYILGIVGVHGEFVEHADSVIRAEQCEILFLFVRRCCVRIAPFLGERYAVPVSVVDNPLQAYQQWILSPDGIKLLGYNAEMLQQHSTPIDSKREVRHGNYRTSYTPGQVAEGCEPSSPS